MSIVLDLPRRRQVVCAAGSLDHDVVYSLLRRSVDEPRVLELLCRTRF